MANSQETPIQKEKHSPHSPPISASTGLTAQTQTQHPQVKSAAPNPTPGTTTTTAGLTPQSGSSSIELTTRDDLSMLYRVLRFLIKPLRPRLVRPPKTPHPEGSPRLSPPKKRNIVIKETKLEGIWMYHLHALGPRSEKKQGIEKAQGNEQKDDLGNADADVDAGSNFPSPHSGRSKGRGFERKHCVYYFSGGGFQSPPSGEHWRFLAQLAQDLVGHRSSVTFPGSQRSVDPASDAKIELIMVSYPLAPNSPASESLRVLRNWLRRVLDDAVINKETVSLMGDSSGGNVIMSLGFWAVQNYDVGSGFPSTATGQGQSQSRSQSQSQSADFNDGPPDGSKGERETQRTHFPLTSLLSISGPMDLTNSSPDVPRAGALDCVLTEEMTNAVANIWCGHDRNRPSQYSPVALSAPEVSPLFQPDAAFRALRDKKLNVHGVYGTHDVLSPSGIDFMKKCQRLGVRGRWLVWEGQMHCFPLAAGGDRLGIREGREARKFVESVLRADAEMED
ncbi:hypothetical protein G647_02962 [Cladophialophora carrionii CBS 160.54]|uniref:Alpha/beta hydrolase fold-3 domain-containing protein n=1 Tax=Cladophialophora carrionii CBS 160.54 TaxID=1279043 RepID=V9DH55_9EURO|nr:uncharacterized protein G647_02962 [Cladophialophora carrionii CBS 160.54]ETI26185.1 hypothetical protein G647_02962 [Cladophialophora carrionii CBS 160.54]